MKLTHTVSSHARCGWALGEIFTFSKIYFFCIFEASGIRLKHKIRGLTQYSCHSDNLWMRRGKRGLICDIAFDKELDRGWISTPICDPLLVKMTNSRSLTNLYNIGGSHRSTTVQNWRITLLETNRHQCTNVQTHTHTLTHARTQTFLPTQTEKVRMKTYPYRSGGSLFQRNLL